MKKFSRALSFVMTLAMLLSGIAAAEQQYFNNGGGGEFVDPHTFTKPYTVNEVIVPADEATGQVALEAHVKNIIEVDGLKFKDLNGNGTLDVYEDWRQPVDARVDDLLSQMTLDGNRSAVARLYRRYVHQHVSLHGGMALFQRTYVYCRGWQLLRSDVSLHHQR